MRPRASSILSTGLCWLLLFGCGGGESGEADGGAEDAGTARDTAMLGGDGGDLPVDASRLDASVDAAVPPEGSVPAFVAVGWGGRRIVSCDLGRTWIGDQQIAPESEDDWHRSYTPKGLAYGAGRFVFLTGWGTDSTVYVSADGLTWESHALDTAYGAVGYADGRFVVVGNRHLSASDDGAATWHELTDLPVPDYDRAGGAFDGIFAAGADDAVQTLLPGGAWQPLASCTGPRHGHIGFEGGFAAGGGILVSVGHAGDTCARDIATGADLGAGSVGAPTPGRPWFSEGAFYVASGDRLGISSDAITWTLRALPSGVSFQLVARAPSGTFVGVANDGDHFYYSDDGTDWQAGSGPSGNGLLYVDFGFVSASAACPAP